MKLMLAVLLMAMIATTSNAQKPVDLSEAANHVGDSVRICGKIYGGRYLSTSNGQPTLLNMGAQFPDHLLTLVIWGEARKNFDGAPEQTYIGKFVCLWGRIELYKDKPQIVLYSSRQLVVEVPIK